MKQDNQLLHVDVFHLQNSVTSFTVKFSLLYASAKSLEFAWIFAEEIKTFSRNPEIQFV